jgi:hypothetical protein
MWSVVHARAIARQGDDGVGAEKERGRRIEKGEEGD